MSIKIVEQEEKQPVDDFWYDLMEGGYINPENFCTNPKDAEDIRLAMNVLKKYKNSLEDAEAIYYL